MLQIVLKDVREHNRDVNEGSRCCGTWRKSHWWKTRGKFLQFQPSVNTRLKIMNRHCSTTTQEWNESHSRIGSTKQFKIDDHVKKGMHQLLACARGRYCSQPLDSVVILLWLRFNDFGECLSIDPIWPNVRAILITVYCRHQAADKLQIISFKWKQNNLRL